jgi:MinD superfamily P-loop ATPase
VPLLAEIPEDRRVAEAYSRGEAAVNALPQLRALFRDLYDRLLAVAARAAGRPVPAGRS